MKFLSTLILLVLTLFCISTASAKIYIWTDENGVKHYSDHLPEGVENYEIQEVPQSTRRDPSADQKYTLEIVNSLKKGYRMGLDRIDEALQQLGVNEIICEGRPFDPRTMNAVDIEDTGDEPDGTVLEVYRAGYMIDSEVLMPAQVKVARNPSK